MSTLACVNMTYTVVFCTRRNDASIYDELTIQDADLIGDVDYGADITGTHSHGYNIHEHILHIQLFNVHSHSDSKKGLVISLVACNNVN